MADLDPDEPRHETATGPADGDGGAPVPDAATIAAHAPGSRRLPALALLVAVLVVYIPVGLVTAVVVAASGVWWPLVVVATALVALVVAAFWTWLGEPRMVVAQAAAIGLLVAVSATFFVVESSAGVPDDALSLVAILMGAAGASAFFATAQRGGTDPPMARTALGAACLLLALHLATLHPLDWFLPVGTWGLAAAVFMARALVTHADEPHPDETAFQEDGVADEA